MSLPFSDSRRERKVELKFRMDSGYWPTLKWLYPVQFTKVLTTKLTRTKKHESFRYGLNALMILEWNAHKKNWSCHREISFSLIPNIYWKQQGVFHKSSLESDEFMLRILFFHYLKFYYIKKKNKHISCRQLSF